MSTTITTLPLGTARRRLLATLLLSLALSACGGGSAEQPSSPAEQVTPDSTAIDGGQATVGAEQPVDELANAAPDDSSAAAGGQTAEEDPSSAGGGPAMPGGGADTGNTVADEVAQLPVTDSVADEVAQLPVTDSVADDVAQLPVTDSVADDVAQLPVTDSVADDVAQLPVTDSVADDVNSPVIDAMPQQPTDIVEDAPSVGDVVAGEPGDVDQLFGDEVGQVDAQEDAEPPAVDEPPAAEIGDELASGSEGVPVAEEGQADAGPVADDTLVVAEQALADGADEDLDGLFGDSGEVVGEQEVVHHDTTKRELRWVLPSQRVDGSTLGSQEVKAIELWGGLAHQPLRRWTTLPPSAQYYGLEQVPKGVYRFAMVTVDRRGLRSEMSATVIRDLR